MKNYISKCNKCNYEYVNIGGVNNECKNCKKNITFNCVCIGIFILSRYFIFY